MLGKLRFRFIFILLFCFNFLAKAQVADVIPGKLVMKLSNAQDVNAINTINALKFGELSLKYPYAIKPTQEELNKGAVDLHKWYELNYDTPFSQAFLIAELKKIEGVEKVEPLYNSELLLNPNDPFANFSSGGQRDWLNLISAYNAWDLTTGDSTLTIAVIDAGTLWNHPDLAQNLRINPNDPINGIDDDRNGFIDDFRGWDFGDVDNNPISTNNGHGNSVASISSARGNNGIGVAGVAFTTKFLPVKVYGRAFTGYDGIVYAANRGCDVINLSWGRGAGGSSAFEQDVINYAVINRNSTVVAAAGNTNGDLDFYPASYDNVVSVIHTTISDGIEPLSSASYKIDLSAPGSNIIAMRTDGTFGNATSGSSFATPMVAGGIALLKSLYPQYNAIQLGELIRVNTDDISQVSGNNAREGKMGKGRLNLLKALRRDVQTSLRATNININSLRSNQVLPGDTAIINMNFVNYLNTVSNFSVVLSSLNPSVRILNGVFIGPSLPANMDINNSTNPFRIIVSPNTPLNTEVVCKLTIVANGIEDVQYFSFRLSNEIINQQSNVLNVTSTSKGRIGFNDVINSQGIGFQYNNRNVAQEIGLVIAENSRRLVNTIFDTNTKDDEFRTLAAIRTTLNNNQIDEVSTIYSDNNAPASAQIGLVIKQTSKIFKQAPANKGYLIEYEIENTRNTTIDSFNIALYTDWEAGNYNRNRANWDSVNNIGYTFEVGNSNPVFCGVKVVNSRNPSYYAIDVVQNFTQNININLFDGFSREEKFNAISQGVFRRTAGYQSATGVNVVSLTGQKVYSLRAGEKRKVAFVLGVANSLSDLQNALNSSESLYRGSNVAPAPVITDTLRTCAGSNLIIAPMGGSRFHFYDNPNLRRPFAIGRFTTINALRRNRTIYITNADSLFESVARTVVLSPNGAIADFSLPNTVNISRGNTLIVPQTGRRGLSQSWFLNGALVSTDSIANLTLTTLGVNRLKLVTRDANCADSLELPFLVSNVTSIDNQLTKNELFEVYPNPSNSILNINSVEKIKGYQLLSLDGKVLQTSSELEGRDNGFGSQYESTIKINNTLSNGIYLLQLNTFDNKSIYRRVVLHR